MVALDERWRDRDVVRIVVARLFIEDIVHADPVGGRG